MKEIDVTTWNRKIAYDCFSNYSDPVFSMTVKLDVTDLVKYSKKTKTSFFLNFLFVVSKCLNDIENFRLRIKDGKVVLFDKIDPSYVVMNKLGAIITKITDFSKEYEKFYNQAKIDIELAKNDDGVKTFNQGNKVDLFYISCVPWVDFLSVKNPYHIPNVDQTSIPRLTWGKFVKEKKKFKMAFDISAHHALMDGYEMSEGFTSIQNALNDIRNFLK